ERRVQESAAEVDHLVAYAHRQRGDDVDRLLVAGAQRLVGTADLGGRVHGHRRDQREDDEHHGVPEEQPPADRHVYCSSRADRDGSWRTTRPSSASRRSTSTTAKPPGATPAT